MTNEKPYIDYSILGIKSFTELLAEGGAECKIFESDKTDSIFDSKEDFFRKGQDTIVTGWCSRDGIERYFAEFGLKITESYTSYIVFIYEKEPTAEDLERTVDDIEGIVKTQLDNVDINTIMDKINKQ